MKTVLLTLALIATLALTSISAFASEATKYMSDGNLIVKISGDDTVVLALEKAGWKKIIATSKYDVTIASYGPSDDRLLSEDGIMVYPVMEKRVSCEDYCLKDLGECTDWFALSSKGYQQKIVERLTCLSALRNHWNKKV